MEPTKRKPKRFLTYFQIPIPPFKEEKFSAHSTTIRFVLFGNIPSKKNNQQAVTVRRKAREWANQQKKAGIAPSWEIVHEAISKCESKMRGNAKYLEFVETYKPIIEAQRDSWAERLRDKGILFPLQKATMSIRFYFKSRHIIDLVNKQQSIQDLLVEANVLANDDYQTVNPIISKGACYYEEIIEDIAFISITTTLQP